MAQSGNGVAGAGLRLGEGRPGFREDAAPTLELTHIFCSLRRTLCWRGGVFRAAPESEPAGAVVHWWSSFLVPSPARLWGERVRVRGALLQAGTRWNPCRSLLCWSVTPASRVSRPFGPLTLALSRRRRRGDRNVTTNERLHPVSHQRGPSLCLLVCPWRRGVARIRPLHSSVSLTRDAVTVLRRWLSRNGVLASPRNQQHGLSGLSRMRPVGH